MISSMNNVAPFGSVRVTRHTISSDEYEYVVTFPLGMGNVPQMRVHTSLLTPFGTATALVTTVTDGNILSGVFRLSFEGETTGDIRYDASEAEIREALELLKTIGSVDVSRSSIDNQHGYSWTIEFTDSLNDGDIESLIADISGLEVSSLNGNPGINITSIDGNELSGVFSLSYNGYTTRDIPFDCSANEFKSALEELVPIPPGTISVERVGPDGELSYGPFSFLRIIIAHMKEIFLISHLPLPVFVEQGVEFVKRKLEKERKKLFKHSQLLPHALSLRQILCICPTALVTLL